MTDFADLNLRFTTQNGDKAVDTLNKVTTGSEQAERANDSRAASEKRSASATAQMIASIQRNVSELNKLHQTQALTRQETDATAAAAMRLAREQAEAARAASQMESRIGALKASVDPVGASIDRMNAELREAQTLLGMGKISLDEYGHATAILNQRLAALDDVQIRGVKSSKMMNMAGINLGRQFADIGVTASMGMSPLMILIQQGPQIADTLTMMKQEGLGVSQVFRNMAVTMGLLRVVNKETIVDQTAVAASNVAAAASASVATGAAGRQAASNMLVAETAAAAAAGEAALAIASGGAAAGSATAVAAANAIAAANTRIASTATAAAAAEAVALAPLAFILGGIVLAVGAVTAAFGLFHRELGKSYPKNITDGLGLTEEQLDRVKHKTVTFGDTVQATFVVIGRAIMDGPVGDALRWLGDLWDKILDFIVEKTVSGVKAIVTGFMTAREMIVKHWKNIPEIFGDIVAGVVNKVVRGVETMINSALPQINKMLEMARMLPGATGTLAQMVPNLKPVDLPEMAVRGAGAAAAADYQSIKAEMGKRVDVAFAAFGDAIRKEAIAIATRKALKEAGDPNKGSSAGAADPRDMPDERSASIAGDIANAQQELLQAQLALTRNVRDRAEIEHALVDFSLAEQNAQIAKQVAGIEDDKGLSAAKKAELIGQLEAVRLLKERVAGMQHIGIDQAASDAALREAMDIQAAQSEIELDRLGLERNGAKTARERREIELRILDLTIQRERAELEGLLARQSISDTDKAIARARLDALNASESSRRQGVEDANKGPGGKYMEGLNLNPDQINEQIEKIKVGGLQSLEDGLMGVIDKTQSLSDAFSNMADQVVKELMRIAIRQMIIKPLGNFLFGGGGIPGFAKGTDDAPGFVRGTDYAPGFANGTDYAPGGMALVGERGPELVNLPRGSQVIPSEATGARMGAGGGTMRTEVKVSVEPSPMFKVFVEETSGPIAQAITVKADARRSNAQAKAQASAF